MKNKKYPDQVVYNETDGFNASFLPYASNVGSPVINPDNISFWKQNSIIKVNHHLKTKFNEIIKEYQRLIDEFKWNELVYSSKFNFEPIIGNTYHLYVGNNEKPFLSIIHPSEWDKEYIGSFKLNTDQMWVKIN